MNRSTNGDPQREDVPLLTVDGLSVTATQRGRTGYILNDVGFQVQRGETVAVVGESGCGKSMTALSIMQLLPPSVRIQAGSVQFGGRDLAKLRTQEMRNVRGNQISMIFQEPMTALNPVYTVGNQLSEPLCQHQAISKRLARTRAVEMLRSVGIPAPEQRIDNYPHEMSGGMRQRVMIAMAMACEPTLLIADEPTTALDVTVQAQIFDLLRAQQQQTGTAIILITHDMGVVAEMADRVVVMYGGRVVEQGRTDDVLNTPRHPYTRGLIACLPELDLSPNESRPELHEIPGIVPSIWQRGKGCPFADRCGDAMARCRDNIPPPISMGRSQVVSCWLYGKNDDL